MIEKIVDGEKFEFPEQYLNEFEFWFGTNNPFQKSMYSFGKGKEKGKVFAYSDTGMCGNDTLVVKGISLVQAMKNKCNATHLGSVK